jgi:hypothetical protein
VNYPWPWRILSGPQVIELHPLCQQEKPVSQGFFASVASAAEKLAGSKRLRAAISTAP